MKYIFYAYKNTYQVSTNTFGYNLLYLSHITNIFSDTTGQTFYQGELPNTNFNGIFDIKFSLNHCSVGVSYFG